LLDCPGLPGETLEEKLLLAHDRRLNPMPAGGRLMRLGRFLRALGRPAQRGAPALADALPWLMPKVRPYFEYEAFTLRTGKPAPEFRPLAGTLAVSLVLDLPNQDLDLGAAELQAWNADFDGLLQTARQNLLARGGEQKFHAVGAGRYRSAWRDGLDGSRILLPAMLRRLPLRGDPVVVLPTRDTLVVVGSEDPESLHWVLEDALRSLGDDPNPLNACPLRLRNLHWEPFQAEDDQPMGALLGRIEQRRLRDEHARRKGL
jgi:hypothetical protein